MYTLHGDTIQAHGLTFKLSIEQDEASSNPWEDCDDFGVVRKASANRCTGFIDKSPGERILSTGDYGCYSWVYDWNATLVKAKREAWGLSDRPANWDGLTKKQRTELAVQRDFDFLRAWCDSEWVWACVCLTLMVEDDDGDLVEYDGPLNFNDSLCGLEFWQHESIDHKKNAYITEIIDEITSAIAHQYRAEAAERTACEERGIVTEAA